MLVCADVWVCKPSQLFLDAQMTASCECVKRTRSMPYFFEKRTLRDVAVSVLYSRSVSSSLLVTSSVPVAS